MNVMSRQRAVLIGAGLFVGSAAGAAVVAVLAITYWLYRDADVDVDAAGVL